MQLFAVFTPMESAITAMLDVCGPRLKNAVEYCVRKSKTYTDNDSPTAAAMYTQGARA